jgi:hypothetical protein
MAWRAQPAGLQGDLPTLEAAAAAGALLSLLLLLLLLLLGSVTLHVMQLFLSCTCVCRVCTRLSSLDPGHASNHELFIRHSQVMLR